MIRVGVLVSVLIAAGACAERTDRVPVADELFVALLQDVASRGTSTHDATVIRTDGIPHRDSIARALGFLAESDSVAPLVCSDPADCRFRVRSLTFDSLEVGSRDSQSRVTYSDMTSLRTIDQDRATDEGGGQIGWIHVQRVDGVWRILEWEADLVVN